MSPLLCVAAVAPGFLLRELFRQFAFAHLRFETAIAMDAGTTAAQLAGLALLVVFGQLNAVSAYLIIAAVAYAAAAIWAVLLRNDVQIRLPAVRTDWTSNWRFARWALLCDLLGLTGAYVLPWLVAYHSGIGEAGLLAAAASIVGIGQLFMNGLSNFILPKAAAAHAADGARGLRRFSLIMLAATPAGDAYTFSELREMFETAGFARNEHIPLIPLPQHLIVSSTRSNIEKGPVMMSRL